MVSDSGLRVPDIILCGQLIKMWVTRRDFLGESVAMLGTYI